VFKDDSTELQGYTGYSPKTGIVVVFRGTTNADNWITNLNIKKVNYSRCNKCKVHDGFYDAWQALQNDTYLQVQQLKSQYRTAPISLTGHSLGGAIATLAAADLK
jgi:predicted lipase